MRIGIVTAVEPLGQGLHRVLASGLEAAFQALGHSVERVLLPFTGARDVLDQIWAFRTVHLSEAFDRIVTLRPPAHLVVHPRKVAWLSAHPDYGDLEERRLAIADRTALLAAEAVFATSAAAASRWLQRTGIQAPVLQSPVPAAVASTASPIAFTAVHLGPGARGARLPALLAALRLAPAARVHLHDGVSDPVLAEELALLAAQFAPGRVELDTRRGVVALADAVAGSKAIVCLSADDDVTLAAMDRADADRRAVIVSGDCQAAADRIAEGQPGFVVDADQPRSIAEALEKVTALPVAAVEQQRPNWDTVARHLLAG